MKSHLKNTEKRRSFTFKSVLMTMIALVWAMNAQAQWGAQQIADYIHSAPAGKFLFPGLHAEVSGNTVTVTGTFNGEPGNINTVTIIEMAAGTTIVWQAFHLGGIDIKGGAGTVEIQDGTLGKGGVVVAGTVDVIMTGGAVTIDAALMSTGAIRKNGTGNITISGGTVTHPSGYGLYHTGSGKITISGTAQISGYTRGISSTQQAEVEINGGSITAYQKAEAACYGIETNSSNNAPLVMTGGEITVIGAEGALSEIAGIKATIIDMTGGTITLNAVDAPKSYGLNTCQLTMTDGTITVNGTGNEAYGLYLVGTNNGLIEKTGGTVTATGENSYGAGIIGRGIYRITGGTISGETDGLFVDNYKVAFLTGTVLGDVTFQNTPRFKRIVEVSTLNIPVAWDGTSNGLTVHDDTQAPIIWDLSGETPLIDFGSYQGANFETMEWGTLDIENSIEQISENSLAIYPNPVKDELTIESGDLTINSVEICDITGKTIQQFNGGTTINVSQLSSGIYFVKIKTDKGDLTKKVIKE